VISAIGQAARIIPLFLAGSPTLPVYPDIPDVLLSPRWRKSFVREK
jgi:hypothetical protein